MIHIGFKGMKFPEKYLLLPLLALAVASCKKGPTEAAAPENDSVKGTYFSTAQFVADQVDLLHDEIYTLEKIVELNGNRDSSIVALPTENWAPVYREFLAADIGQPKYLDRYRFSQFDDATTFTNNYVYEAAEPKLPVRRIMISADAETHRIKSFLAETETSNFWGSTRKKLYYAPRKIIQIQETNTSLIGPDKTFRVEYRFLINRQEDDE